MKNLENIIFIFDVDSTLVKTETLDDIIEIAVDNDCKCKDNKDLIMKNIKEITDLGMSGNIDFETSLIKRFEIAHILQKHLNFYNEKVLRKYIDFNFKKIISFIQESGGNVFIISGGFGDSINIIADELGVPLESTFANEFIKDKDCVVGFDKNNCLVKNDGKVSITKNIKFKYPNKKVICIGDGNSDYLIKKNGVADEFWGFWQNTKRNSLIKVANQNFYSSKELLEFITN
jgi:HAD superfamily phosphoserine phosphatase-like hydrolase